MAKKVDLTKNGKDTNLDDFDDFSDFDDFDFGGMGGEDDNRKPITKIKAGLKSGLKLKDNKGKIAKAIASTALPKAYTESLDKIDNLKYTASNVFDDVIKDMEPGIKNLKKMADKSLPFTSKFLPKKITERIKKFSTSETGSSNYYSNDNSNDSEINSTLQTIFGAQRVADAHSTKINDLHRETDRKIGKNQFLYTAKVQSSMASNLSRLVGYQDTVLDQYYRKSLELQQRQYFATRDLLELNRLSTSNMLRELSSITKNTGLPNEVKINKSELFTSMYTNKIINASLSNMGERLKKNTGKFMKDFASSFNSTSDMLSSGGSGIDPYLMMGDIAGSGILQSAGALAGKQFQKYGYTQLDKINPNISKSIRRGANTLDRLNNHLPRYINRKIKESDGNGLWGIGKSLLGTSSSLDSFELRNNLHKEAGIAVPWDMISRRTLIEVIPGFMARTLDKVSDIYAFISGTKNTNKGLRFSSLRENFVTSSNAEQDLKRLNKNTISPAIKDYVKEIVDFVDDGTLTQSEKIDLSLTLARDAGDDLDFDPTRYIESSKINSKSAKRIAEMFKNAFDITEKIDANTFKVTRSLGKSDKISEAHAKLSHSFSRLGNGLGNFDPIIKNYIASGEKGLLHNAGMINPDTGLLNQDYRFNLVRELLEADNARDFYGSSGKQYIVPDIAEVLKSKKKNVYSNTMFGGIKNKFNDSSFGRKTNKFLEENHLTKNEILKTVDKEIEALNVGEAKSVITEEIVKKLDGKPITRENIQAEIIKEVKNINAETVRNKVKASYNKIKDKFSETGEGSIKEKYSIFGKELKNKASTVFDKSVKLDNLVELTKASNETSEVFLNRIAVGIENLQAITASQIQDPEEKKGVFKKLIDGGKSIIKGELWLGKKIRAVTHPILKKTFIPAIKLTAKGILGLGGLGIDLSKFGIAAAISGIKKLPRRLMAGAEGLLSMANILSGPAKTALLGLLGTGKTVGGHVLGMLGKVPGRLGKGLGKIAGMFGNKNPEDDGYGGLFTGLFGFLGNKEDRVYSKLNDIYKHMQTAFPIQSKAERLANREGGYKDILRKRAAKKAEQGKGKDGILSKAGNAAKDLLGGASKAATAAEGAGTTSTLGTIVSIAGSAIMAVGAYVLFKKSQDKGKEIKAYANTKLSSLEQVRYLQYGCPINNKYAIHSIRYLEYCIADEISFNGNKINFKLKPDEVWDRYGEAFGNVMSSDTDSNSLGGQHIRGAIKQKQIAFTNWFYNRFFVVYTTHCLAALNLEKKSIDDVEKMSTENKVKFISLIQFGSKALAAKLNPMAISDSPWKLTPLVQSTGNLSNLITNLNTEYSVSQNKTNSKAGFIVPIKKQAQIDQENAVKKKDKEKQQLDTASAKQAINDIKTQGKEKSTLDTMKDWAKINILDRGKALWNSTKDTASDIWNGIKTGASNLGAGIISGAKSGANWVNKNVVMPVKNSLAALVQGAESGLAGYNAYNRGTVGNRILGSVGPRNLTNMTIAEIFTDMQRPHSDPQRLFAVGKYQCIPSTLADAVRTLGIPQNTLFDENCQERIFSEYLLDKKPGHVKIANYIKGKSDDINGAMDSMASEWASIADPRTGTSKYGNGNKASVSPEALAGMLNKSKNLYQQYISAGMNPDEAYQKAVSTDSSMISDSATTKQSPSIVPAPSASNMVTNTPVANNTVSTPVVNTTANDILNKPLGVPDTSVASGMPDLSHISNATIKVGDTASKQRDAHLAETQKTNDFLAKILFALGNNANMPNGSPAAGTSNTSSSTIEPVINMSRKM